METEAREFGEAPPSYGMNRLTIQALLLGLFFFSGVAGLGYQVLWAKMLAAGFGHELPAVLAVASMFLGGMAVGAWTLDQPLARTYQPGRWYAVLEWVLGGWAALTPLLLPLLMGWLADGAGSGSSGRSLSAWLTLGVVLLPCTFCLGASLPAMDRFLTPWTERKRCVGAVYAVYTLGAALGVLGALYLLAPLAGFRSAIWILAGLNGCVGWAAWRMSRVPASLFLESSAVPLVEVSRSRLLLTAAVGGLFGMGFEWAGVRALGQVLENTLYTHASVLAVYLVSTSAGAALFHRHARNLPASAMLSMLLIGLGTLVVISLFAMDAAPVLYGGLRAVLGAHRVGVLCAEVGVALVVLGPPATCMGALFSLLAQAARTEKGGVGRVLAVNVMGGALAGWLCGAVLMPWLGLRWMVILLAAGYLALLPWPIASGRVWLVAPATALLLHLLLPWSLVAIPEGRKLVAQREGWLASVTVTVDEQEHRALQVNNRFQMGGTAAAVAQRLQAHLPLLLHADPRRVLFLGVGTGITMEGAAVHPNIQAEGVELLPEVVAVMPWFQPYNAQVLQASNLVVTVADARRFVRSAEGSYDVIVGDLFHPARDGAGFLYTREHFEAIRGRLKPGGLFCQWIPLGQVDRPVADVMIRTFMEVFPEAHAWLLRFNVDVPVLGLMSSLPAVPYVDDWVEVRSAHAPLRAALRGMSLGDSIRYFGHHLAGPEALARLCRTAAVATDDWPVVSFLAPAFAARPDAEPHGRLMAMIQELRVLRKDLDSGLEGSGLSGAMQVRLESFRRARDIYLEGLVYDAQQRREAAMEAYLSSARYSRDFTAGYAQCLSLASLLAESDPATSRRLLERLDKVQPDNPVAGELLRRLFPDE